MRSSIPTHIIAHRCNTLASLAHAVDIGAHGAECDVQISSDGIPVLFHDKYIAKDIKIADQPFADLNAITPLVKLQDWLNYVKKNTPSNFCLMLELKSNHPHLPEAVLKAVDHCKLTENLTILSFLPSHIKWFKDKPITAAINIGEAKHYHTDIDFEGVYVEALPTSEALHEILGAPPKAISLAYPLWQQADNVLRSSYLNIGCQVILWTLNKADQLPSLGFHNALITDIPEAFI